MNGDQYAGRIPPAMTPPTKGELAGQPSTWPKVIGILLIVLGSLGILMHGCGGIAGTMMTTAFSGMMQSANGNDPFQAQMEVAQRYMPWNLAKSVVLLSLGIVILVAGIGLLQHKWWSVKLAVGWAVTRILCAIPVTYIDYVISMKTFEAMKQAAADSGQPMPGGMFAMMHAFGLGAMIIGLIFICAMPVFVLIWFSRAKIKAQIAAWNMLQPVQTTVP